MKPKTKVIEVNGKKYKLSKMDARTGSYVAFKLAVIVAPALKGGEVEKALSQISTLPRNEFDELQSLLLGTVTELKTVDGQELPMPLMRNGSFINEELQFDVASIMQLTVQAAMFNIGDFFSGNVVQKQ
jgi:hypothetical protein